MVSELAMVLLEVIDGTNDVPKENAETDKIQEYRESGRFENTPQNKLVGDVRVHVYTCSITADCKLSGVLLSRIAIYRSRGRALR